VANLGELEMLQRLGVALAIGLLVGTERGWSTRQLAEGRRVAGIRTFGLIGLLGGLWAFIGSYAGELVLAIAFAALATLLIVAYVQVLKKDTDIGATSMVAALVTFGLGALASFGELEVATSGAVIMTLLLGVKPELHRLVMRIERRELAAVIQLLLMSVVLLPVLPNQGYGPWQALNPFRIWWMIILIAAISFAGYVAIKAAGARLGILLTGIFGGMASSTATTLSLARLGKSRPSLHPLLSAGVIVACATMFPRMLLLAWVIAPSFAFRLLLPLGLAGVAAYGVALWTWRGASASEAAADLMPSNPFEFGMAVKYGALLAAIMVLSFALQDWFGQTGLFLLALVSGLADVDAVTLTFGGRVADASLAAALAAWATLAAAFSNTVVKIGLVAMSSGGAMLWRVALGLGASIAAAALGIAIQELWPAIAG